MARRDAPRPRPSRYPGPRVDQRITHAVTATIGTIRAAILPATFATAHRKRVTFVTFAGAIALLLSLVALPSPARADDIAATGRGVVRVVLLATVNGRIVGYSHGSGVAVAPDRVVTNAHVVELSQRFPANVVIGVVPSEGDKSVAGQVLAYDPQRDLALIGFKGARLPAATLYTGPQGDGEAVTALGYPGNVDLATASSADDYIRPMTPVRGEGVLSGLRAMSGVQVLLHSARIARGNSGGPLVDRCGRVLGINSALTRGEEGDASFGFAVANSELQAFLREASQAVATTGVACTSIEERLDRDRAAEARDLDTRAAAAREAAAKTASERAAALATARADAERTRENVMALAALLLVAGALGLGAGGLLESRGDRRRAIWAASAGGVLILAAVLTFVLRPSGEPTLPEPAASGTAAAASAALGPRLCTIDPDRSRVTVSDTSDVRIDWRGDGCVNGRTQYAEAGGTNWQRILVPNEDQTVSVLAFDPASETYSNTRYLLSATQMADARRLRAEVKLKACSTDGAARAALTGQQTAIRDALPALPNEKLVYRCRRGE